MRVESADGLFRGAMLFHVADLLPRPLTSRYISCDVLRPSVYFARRFAWVSIWCGVFLRCIQVDGKVRTDVNFPAGFMGESDETALFLLALALRMLLF